MNEKRNKIKFPLLKIGIVSYSADVLLLLCLAVFPIAFYFYTRIWCWVCVSKNRINHIIIEMKWKNNRNQSQREHADTHQLNNHIQSTQSALCTMQWILFIAASTENGFYFSISRYERRGVATADADMVTHLFLYISVCVFVCLFIVTARGEVKLEHFVGYVSLSLHFYMRAFRSVLLFPFFLIHLLHSFCSLLRHEMSNFL